MRPARRPPARNRVTSWSCPPEERPPSPPQTGVRQNKRCPRPEERAHFGPSPFPSRAQNRKCPQPPSWRGRLRAEFAQAEASGLSAKQAGGSRALLLSAFQAQDDVHVVT